MTHSIHNRLEDLSVISATNRIGNGIEQRLLAERPAHTLCASLEVMGIQGLAHQRF